MKNRNLDFAIITPLANESEVFNEFSASLSGVLDKIASGKVYLIVDNASKDNTLGLCKQLSKEDNRFVTVWAPENRNVVDAYIRGYKEAYKNDHEYIIEMDGGLSHDPEAIPDFIQCLEEGYDCVFGSRFMKGGSIENSNFKRTFLSKVGTILSTILLGTKMKDMTSGYQGFRREIVGKLLDYNLLSKAHFYQTEVRYLLRNSNYIEIPIHYSSPSPSVSKKAIKNSLQALFHYFLLRLKGKAPDLSND
jgi:dolichol-phosphate mannosyltransferase